MLLRMARPSRPDVPGAFYHVLTRGNRRATIFHDDTDYRACLARLERYRQRDGLTLYAYVLMPNYLYLLLETLFQPHQQTADPRRLARSQRHSPGTGLGKAQEIRAGCCCSP